MKNEFGALEVARSGGPAAVPPDAVRQEEKEDDDEIDLTCKEETPESKFSG